MCKICNLFSPNKSLLLSHVIEKHTDEGGNGEDIIIPLKPLQTSHVAGMFSKASMSAEMA